MNWRTTCAVTVSSQVARLGEQSTRFISTSSVWTDLSPASARYLIQNPKFFAAMETDVLSEVLRSVRLTGAIFLRAELTEPWGLRAPKAGAAAALLAPGT